jgi:hypothetical protein
MPMMNRAVDCIVCGTCTADILVKPVGLTAPIGGGRLFDVDPIDVTTGGIVCNSGIAMRRLGLAVAAASIVGDDVWGGVVRRRLDAEGIAAAGVEGHASQATSSTAVLIDPSGERSFAHHVGACRAIDVAYLRRQTAELSKARLVLLGYFGLLPALEPTIGEAVALLRGLGCQVALETGGSGGALAGIAPGVPEPTMPNDAHVRPSSRPTMAPRAASVSTEARPAPAATVSTQGRVLRMRSAPTPGRRARRSRAHR